MPCRMFSYALTYWYYKGFIIGRETPADDPEAGTFHTGPNQWPKALRDEDFRLPLMDYHRKMIEMVRVILQILAKGLPREWNCPPDVFDELTINPSAPMRLLYYAPQPVKHDNQFGGRLILPHTHAAGPDYRESDGDNGQWAIIPISETFPSFCRRRAPKAWRCCIRRHTPGCPCRSRHTPMSSTWVI